MVVRNDFSGAPRSGKTRQFPGKQLLTLVTGLLVLGFSASGLVAGPAGKKVQETKEKAKEKLAEAFGLNLAIKPDNKGNIGVGTDFQYNVWGPLNIGGYYMKMTKSDVKEVKAKKEISVIDEQQITFKGLAYKWEFGEDFAIMPGLNGQYLFQDVTLNNTDRAADTFKSEDSNLESIQATGSLEAWIPLFGAGKIYLIGSYAFYTPSKESGTGFDSALIATEDEFKNTRYSGPTGEYTFETETNTNLLEVEATIDFYNPFGIGDMLVGFKMRQLKYDFTSKRFLIDNGSHKEFDLTKNVDRLDLTVSVGMELAFLDFGLAKPIGSFNYTKAKYQNAVGKDVDDNIFAFGIAIKK